MNSKVEAAEGEQLRIEIYQRVQQGAGVGVQVEVGVGSLSELCSFCLLRGRKLPLML